MACRDVSIKHHVDGRPEGLDGAGSAVNSTYHPAFLSAKTIESGTIIRGTGSAATRPLAPTIRVVLTCSVEQFSVARLLLRAVRQATSVNDQLRDTKVPCHMERGLLELPCNPGGSARRVFLWARAGWPRVGSASTSTGSISTTAR
jgi:hypothetical protein